MAKPIFISYRRMNEGDVLRVIDRIISTFGKDNVFFDQSTIEVGDRWRERLEEVSGALVVIIFIGKSWEDQFQKKIDIGAKDYVLYELRRAIKRESKRETTILPVVIGRPKQPPNWKALPARLQSIHWTHYIAIEHDSSYLADMLAIDLLLKKISEKAQIPANGIANFPLAFNPPVTSRQTMGEHLRSIVSNVWAMFSRSETLDTDPLSVAVWGLPGIGKSTLAYMVATDQRLKEKFKDGVLFGRLGMDAGEDAVIKVLTDWADLLNVSNEQKIKLKHIGDWRAIIQQRLEDRQVLIVIDDIWSFDEGRSLQVGGTKCAYFFTTRQEGVAIEIAGDNVMRLPKLDTVQSMALIKHIAPRLFVAGENADQVLSRVHSIIETLDGLPLALVLLASSLRRTNHATESNEIDAILARLEDVESRLKIVLPNDHNGNTKDRATLSAIINLSYDALALRGEEGLLMQNAFRRLSVLRPDPMYFGQALAKKIAGTNLVTINELKSAGLLDRLHNIAITSSDSQTTDGEEDINYIIHRSIAESVSMKLAPSERELVTKLAMDHYAERQNHIEEGFLASAHYKSKYRYEFPEWQYVTDNWRYYLGKMSSYDDAALAVTKLWFGAFWWWGCFSDFQYCDQLTADWPVGRGQVSSARDDLANLQSFKNAYPKESAVDRVIGQRQNWLTVRGCLGEIQKSRCLDGDGSGFDSDRCELRGLLSVFTAESYRFGEQNYERAEEYYRDAIEMFSRSTVTNADSWNLSWGRYHLADCLFESGAIGRLAEADSVAELAVISAINDDDSDEEVLAVLCRVRGDIAAHLGDLPGAITNFHKAVLYAYSFQILTGEPDAYTIRFYPMIAQRVADSIIALHGRNRSAAHEVAAGLATLWNTVPANIERSRNALECGNALDLRLSIFATEFADEKNLSMDEKRREYAHTVRSNIAALKIINK